MAAISWKTGVSGNWSTATDWSGGVVPGAGDTVTIADAGTYTVTIASAAAADALTLNAAGATVADNSVLTIGATLKLTNGQFQLNSGGEISGGVLSATGGSFVWNGGTLNGVTYDGVLDLSAGNATLDVSGGLTVTGTNGTGPGTIDLTGGGSEGASLDVAGNETLDNATLNIGSATLDTLYLVDPNDTTPTLTLGAHFTIDQTGLFANILDNTNNANDTVVNDGTINAGVEGGLFLIAPANFTNDGTITVSDGGDLLLAPSSEFIEGAGGSITVAAGSELDLGISLTTAQLSAFANSGTIGIGAVLDNTGATLTVGPGTSEPTIQLGLPFLGTSATGEIDGGTIVDEGSGMTFAGGTLSDVTYQGTLDLSAANATVTVNDGFTATGVSGSGSGLINLTGSGALFYATGGETLDNMTVDIGSATGSNIYFYDPADATTQLTLGSHFDIVQVGAEAGLFALGFSNDTLTFGGTLTAGVSGGIFTVTLLGGLTNNGAIDVSNGETLVLSPATFTQGSTGTVTVSSGAVLKLGFALTTAQLLSEFTDNAGVIGIGATLTNTGATLSTGSGTTLPAVQLDSGGVIVGGTIVDKGSGVQFLGGTLSDVTYEGTLNLAAAGASVLITDGFTATGSGGTGAGLIDLSGAGATLDVFGNETLDNATVDLGAGASLDVYDPGDVDPVLTLGGNLSIVQTGNIATIGDGAWANANDAIVNDGAIKAGVASGELTISVPVFTNNGSITASGGDTVLLQPGTLTNLSGSTLTGGLYQADAGSTIQYQNVTIATDAADIVLDGAGSAADSLDTSTGVKTDIEATLTSITAAGKLQVLGSRDWTSTNALPNAGTLDLGGGTFTVASITNSGLISGYGDITTPIANTGTISVASGKSLSLVGGGLTNLSGTTLTGGALVVGAAGTLQLADNASIATLSATIDLAGVGSTLQSLNTTTSSEVTLQSSLKTIGADGVLEVLGGGSYSTANAISNSGVLQLAGGTFTAASLTDAAGSTLKGYGAVDAAVSNAGTVLAQANQTLSLPDGATNLTGTTLTGGVWTVDAGGALQLANNASITTLDATIDLAGAGATIQALDTSTSEEVGLESTLTTIGASGVLEVLGSRGYSTSLAISNSGAIQLGGGTLSSGELTDLGGSSLSGSGKVASVFSDAGTVTASGGTLTFTATGDTFAGTMTGGALAFSGGSDALNAGASLTAGSWTIAQAATVSVNTNLTASGKVSQNSGTSLTIGASDTLTLTGTGSTLSGAITGSGALSFGGGTATLGSGLTLSVANLSVSGAATSVTVGSSRTYHGAFTQSAGTLSTGAFTLTLTGAASFGPSAVVRGSGGLALQGATSISGLTIGGTEVVSNTGTVTETGQLTVGDGSTSAAQFTNAAGGVYDISGDIGIGKGAAAGSLFTNAGTLAKTSGTGISHVRVNVTDTGAVTVDSGGILEFDGATDSFSGAFGGAGKVLLGAGASSLSTLDLSGGVTVTNAGKVSQSGVLTIASGNVTNNAGANWDFTSANGIVLATGGTGSFNNAGTLAETGGTGVTHVGIDLTDTGTISVASGGALEFDGTSNSFSGGIGGPGTVTLGAGVSDFDGNNLTGAVTLDNTGTVNQSGGLTVTDGAADNEAGASWDITNNVGMALASGGSGAFTNAGTLAKTAGTGVSTVGVDVTNTGTINVAAGTLEFDGPSSSFAGTISGSGTLAFGAGSSTLSSGLTLSVANVSVSGASVTVGSSRTYAGTFTESAGSLATGAFTLTLTGAATFGPAAAVTGSGGGLALKGATSISGLAIGGTDAAANTGTVTETGQLTVGDGSTSAAKFTNAAGGVYDISGDSGIGQGAAAGSLFTNAGTLAKTSGTGVSSVGVNVTDTGAVTVDSGGTLEFDGANNRFSGTFGGAGTVEISGGTDTLSALTISAAQVDLTNAAATLSGAISNSGAVSISGGAVTVAAVGATLSGAGSITLSDNAANTIEGATSASKLTVDTTLEGAGHLGAGQMMLVNQSGGVIESVGANALTIDTGANAITNAGTIEAVGAGGVTINSAVDNTGVLAATDSNMTVNGAVTGAGKAQIGSGVLFFASGFVENATFLSGATGTLELSDSQAYTGTITGFSLTGANALDLNDISYGIFTTWSYSGTAAGGTLTVTDGTHTANIKLTGDYLDSTFLLNPDGHFGLLVTDPAAPRPAGASQPPGLAPMGSAQTDVRDPPAVLTGGRGLAESLRSGGTDIGALVPASALMPPPAPADLFGDAHRLVAAMAAFCPSEGVSFGGINWTPPLAGPALLASPAYAH